MANTPAYFWSISTKKNILRIGSWTNFNVKFEQIHFLEKLVSRSKAYRE